MNKTDIELGRVLLCLLWLVPALVCFVIAWGVRFCASACQYAWRDAA